MKTKIISSDITYSVPSSDRYIRVIEDEHEVIGIGYWQGEDPYELIEIDEDLTDLFNALECNLKGDTQIDRIDNAIWCYHNYEVLRADRASEKERQAKLKALQDQYEQ